MFLHDIPPVCSQDGLKIKATLKYIYIFFQRAQYERDEPFKEKKNANLSTALFHPKANKWKVNPSSSKVPLSNLKDKREHRFTS